MVILDPRSLFVFLDNRFNLKQDTDRLKHQLDCLGRMGKLSNLGNVILRNLVHRADRLVDERHDLVQLVLAFILVHDRHLDLLS